MTTEQIRQLHDIHDKLGAVIGELEDDVDSTPVECLIAQDDARMTEVNGINTLIIGRAKPLPKGKRRRRKA